MIMTQELVIECGTFTHYKVIIEVTDINVLEKVKDHAAVQGKEGEDLVKALLEQALPPETILNVQRKNANDNLNDGPKGEPSYVLYNPEKAVSRVNLSKGEMRPENHLSILKVHHRQDGNGQDTSDGKPAIENFSKTTGKLILQEYNKNGFLENPPNGEPARQRFADDGTPTGREYAVDTKFIDPPNGEPAKWAFDPETKQTRISHYRDGQLNDLPDGTPAFQIFNSAGKLIEAQRYKDGKHEDAADGTPSCLSFNGESGELVNAWRYKGGEQTENLTPHAVRKARKSEAIKTIQKLHL
jgi:hypothetical protein